MIRNGMMWRDRKVQSMLWWGITLCFGILLALFIMISFRMVTYGSLLIGSLVVPVLISRLFRQSYSAQQIIMLAWLIRVLLMAILKVYSYQAGLGGFYPGDVDAVAYDKWSVFALQQPNWLSALHGYPPYFFVVAALYHLFGRDLAIPELVNLGMSVMSVPLLYELGRRMRGESAGRTAAIWWSLMPSGVYFSVSLLKDMTVVFAILLTAFLVLGISRGSLRKDDVVIGLLGTALLGFIRPQYILALVLTLLLVLFFTKSKGKSSLRKKILILLCIVVLLLTGAGEAARQDLFTTTSQAGANWDTEVAMAGNSGIGIATSVPTYARWIVEFPFSVLAPFPWQWGVLGSGLGKFSGLEMLVWYVLYARIWRNRKSIMADNAGRAMLFYAFAFFLAVSFGLPNIGSMYRYRWPALTLLLTLLTFAPKKDQEVQTQDEVRMT